MGKFSKSRVRGKVPERSALVLGGIQFSPKHSVEYDEESSRANNQLDSFVRFDRTQTCDRQTGGQTDGRRTLAYTALASIASRGKNVQSCRHEHPRRFPVGKR